MGDSLVPAWLGKDNTVLALASHPIKRITRITTLRHRNVFHGRTLPHRASEQRLQYRIYSSNRQPEPEGNEEHSEGRNSGLSWVKELVYGKQTPKQAPPQEPPAQGLVATFEPLVKKFVPRETPQLRWRRRKVLGTGEAGDADESRWIQAGNVLRKRPEIAFRKEHISLLLSPSTDETAQQRRPDFVTYRHMRSWVQVLTTPTADTPGTTLILHFDNKRYLIGNLAEGTQRACVQMGARLLKVSECFITGRTEWRNTGGLIGMILTLADAVSSSAAASNEDAIKRARAKGKRLGYLEDVEKMRQLEEEAKKETSSRLTLFSAPNLNHTLATARRFVFRKGMPVDVHEISESSGKREGEDEWAPYWADENIKVWAMPILPSSSTATLATNGTKTVSPRKRSIDEVYEREPVPDGGSTVTASSLTPKERDQLTVKAVVSEMFNSSWRLDTLHETPLSEVKLPANMFIRNAETNKLEKFTVPPPGSNRPAPDPNMTVLVRKPWPGALIESLPPTEPAKEAVSYIIRNHTQRGKFHPERAVALKVEKGLKWAQLSSGNAVQNQDGETITPDMVLGESKEGGGLAIVDLPEPSYIDALLARPEWREPKVMAGVGAIVWICGPGVGTDERVVKFMHEFSQLRHVVSSPEYCPNNIALDSAAAATVRLRQVDPARYTVPDHDNELPEQTLALPTGVHRAVRGQMVQLEPSLEVHSKQAIPFLNIPETEAETSPEILEEAKKAQIAVREASEATQKWASTLPPNASAAEIVTLGTGSALPSKYRNVSATLLRVPGWGSMLFDCGENTLGQLKRVFPPDELKQILGELRMIWISHMHADHHLGTVSVIRAWYEEVHASQPVPAGQAALDKDSFDTRNGLALVSEPAMLHWLSEYASIEDYGYSRLVPLCISPANTWKRQPSTLGWFVPPSELAALGTPQARKDRTAQSKVSSSLLNLTDIQAVPVQHCHGARAVSITFPSSSSSTATSDLPFKVSYSGDCRPSKPFSIIGKNTTVCIHEATFDDELQGDAQAKQHSTTSEALGVAQAMGAKACVLTHFSQRYQKMPVLEHASAEQAKAVADDAAMAGEEVADPDEEMEALDAPLEDATTTLPADQPSTTSSAQQATTNNLFRKTSSRPEAVKFKLASDMKVAVAFDYMRVKVGDIARMQHFTPALLKLFEEEEKPEPMEVAVGKKGKGKQGKQNKGQRGNG